MGLIGHLPSPEARRAVLKGLADKVLSSGEFRGDFWILVDGAALDYVTGFLRDTPGLDFDSFVDLCGVDRLPLSPRFEVVVHLYSRLRRHRIRVKAAVPDATLTVPSLTCFFMAADWQEREAYDMYGISFRGHPNLKRILSPPGSEAFPQRRDYPLRGDREGKEDK